MESRFILVLSLLFAFSQAHVLVPRSIGNCPGSEGYPLQFVDGVIPDEILIPGTVSVNMHSRISKDLPNDLMIKMKLKKLEPFPMDVPCLNGLGSCPYDMCETIVNMGDSLCPSFPEGQPCGCPLLAGDLDIKNVELAVPDFGPILGSLMAGRYDAQATFYADSDPDTLLGCIDMSFKFVTA